MGREVTDAELLNDEPDDVVSQETQDSLDELKDEEADEIVEAKDGKDGKDEFDIVIREDDDDPDAGTDDANIDAKGDDGVGEHVDDDAGTDVTDDFLTPDEKKNYSKAMQKRITRERRAKEDAEGRAITEATARRAAESRALKADKINVSLMLAMVTRDIETKTAALKQAKEDGDTDAEVKALGELGDLQAKKREAEGMKDALDKTPEPAAEVNAPPNQVRWKGKNRWFENPDFAVFRAAALAIDNQIAAEKTYTKQSTEWYAELDRRIARELPGLRAKINTVYGSAGTQQQARARQPQARVAPVNRSPAGTRTPSNRFVLTRDDISMAKQMGLNTDITTAEGKEHMRRFARNRASKGA